MLPGIGMHFGVGAAVHQSAPTIVYCDQKEAANGIQQNTEYTGVNLGTPAANRYILVAVSTNNNSRTLTSITIAGVTATQVGSKVSSSTAQCWMFIAAVPTGLSGTISGLPPSTENNSIMVWALYDLTSPTPISTSSSTTNTPSTSVTIGANQVAIAYGRATAASPAIALSGVGFNTDYASAPPSDNLGQFGGKSNTPGSGTLTGANSTNNCAMQVGVFG